MKEYTSFWQIHERGGLVYKEDASRGESQFYYAPALTGGWFSVEILVDAKEGNCVGHWHSHTFLGGLSQPAFSTIDERVMKKFTSGTFWLRNNLWGTTYRLTKKKGEPDDFQELKDD